MHARCEHTLSPVTRHHGIEERPDSIVGGDDCFDTSSKVTRRAGLDDVEFGVIRAVQQQTMSLNEVGQEFVCGNGRGRRINDTSLGARVGDERIHLFALRVCGGIRRAFSCEPDAQSFRDSPDVEQHTAQEENLEALAKRAFAARSLYHVASLRGNWKREAVTVETFFDLVLARLTLGEVLAAGGLGTCNAARRRCRGSGSSSCASRSRARGSRRSPMPRRSAWRGSCSGHHASEPGRNASRTICTC